MFEHFFPRLFLAAHPFPLTSREAQAHTVHDMGRHMNDRLQGTIDLLVLKSLAKLGKMHGYGITVHIQSVSKDALRIEEGSLYPALHRMEQSGWIKAEWGTSENKRRARFYSLTPLGRRELAMEEQNWTELTGAVARFLKYA